MTCHELDGLDPLGEGHWPDAEQFGDGLAAIAAENATSFLAPSGVAATSSRGHTIYPWLFNIAMENGPCIGGLPIKHGDFPWLC